jgi:ferredoxin-NADP reductase
MMATATSVYTAQLISRHEIADGTMAFHFAKPADFHFRASQSVDLTLLNPPETDAEGNTRAFSIASAPFDDDLMIATRMRDTAFKRVLRKSGLPREIKIEGPSGSFVLHRKVEKAALFLAGGIGITPFLSIIRQAAHEDAPHQLYFFIPTGARKIRLSSIFYLRLQRQNPKIHLIVTMTEMDNSHREWKDETGFISKDMLTKYLPSLEGPIYYLAGPSAKVGAMRRMLTETGIDEDDIRTEEFSGY